MFGRYGSGNKLTGISMFGRFDRGSKLTGISICLAGKTALS